MYVSYIYNDAVWVAQLSSNAKSEVKSQQVYSPPSNIVYLEGSRFYKRNGTYYILLTHPANEEWVIKSNSPFGSYSMEALVQSVAPLFLGGLVDTPNSQWYYMAFIDAYPGGAFQFLLQFPGALMASLLSLSPVASGAPHTPTPPPRIP
ncbi:hypothetical protein FRC00_013511 [Tulasnella sp. 408]|nr:hypothetical protein FRC00_013511 [Tulasnella sp. 408]